MKTSPIDFAVNNVNDEVLIEGIRYSGALFRSMAMLPIGTVIRIIERKDGLLTVERLNYLSGNTPVQQAQIEFEEERFNAAVRQEKKRLVHEAGPMKTWGRFIADLLPFSISIRRRG